MLTQVGVVEVGGNNRGKQVEEYLRSVNMPAGQPWCAAIIVWAMNKCNIKHRITAWSPSAYNKNDVIFTDGEFKTQDWSNDDVLIGTLSYDKFKSIKSRYKGIGHVFDCLVVGKRSVITIEGNTNDAGDRDSRSGDGVYRKKRPLTRNTHLTRWKKFNQSTPM